MKFTPSVTEKNYRYRWSILADGVSYDLCDVWPIDSYTSDSLQKNTSNPVDGIAYEGLFKLSNTNNKPVLMRGHRLADSVNFPPYSPYDVQKIAVTFKVGATPKTSDVYLAGISFDNGGFSDSLQNGYLVKVTYGATNFLINIFKIKDGAFTQINKVDDTFSNNGSKDISVIFVKFLNCVGILFRNTWEPLYQELHCSYFDNDLEFGLFARPLMGFDQAGTSGVTVLKDRPFIYACDVIGYNFIPTEKTIDWRSFADGFYAPIRLEFANASIPANGSGVQGIDNGLDCFRYSLLPQHVNDVRVVPRACRVFNNSPCNIYAELGEQVFTIWPKTELVIFLHDEMYITFFSLFSCNVTFYDKPELLIYGR